MKEHRDATWLFDRPGHKSEQWWTSLASMLLIYLARHAPDTKIALWRYKTEGVRWWFQRTDRWLAVADATFSSVMVEASLRASLFPGVPWSDRFISTPDLLIHRPDRKWTTMIENKTKNAGVGRLAIYKDAVNHLQNHKWDARLCIVISCGHPNDSIWDTVERLGLELLLWEDMLRLLDQTEWFCSLFDEPLGQYYMNPALEGSKGK